MNPKSSINPVYELKRIHLWGTVWLFLCIFFLLVFIIYQRGFQWWLIFSISSYSAVIVLFLLMVYSFAIYKGVVRNLNSIEHPLTTSPYYVLLYDLAPFLGTLAGIYAAFFSDSVSLIGLAAAQGTLAMTFVMWIVFDSLAGIIEAALPQSTVHRKNRIVEIQEKKHIHNLERQRLLEQLGQQEKQSRSQWTLLFQPYALEVADLLCNPSSNIQAVRQRIVELGALAWQKGAMLGMHFLHATIVDEVKKRSPHPSVDFVSLYWDGIGGWRKPSLLSQMYI